jgi:hypothetical protein
LKGRRSGSVNLKPSLKTILKNKNDVILISDTGMISNQQPSTTGLRLSYVEVKLLIYIPVYTVVQLPINQYFAK